MFKEKYEKLKNESLLKLIIFNHDSIFNNNYLKILIYLSSHLIKLAI
jgi:hypothetical protein